MRPNYAEAAVEAMLSIFLNVVGEIEKYLEDLDRVPTEILYTANTRIYHLK